MKKIFVLLGLIQPLYSTTIYVPRDIPTLEEALANDEVSTVILEEPGTHTLGKQNYASIRVEAPTTSHTGIYYGQLIGTFQEGSQITGRGPYSLVTSGSTVSVEGTTLEVMGQGMFTGRAPEFSEVIPGVDRVYVIKRDSITMCDILHAEGNSLTLSEPVAFEPGEGFTIAPRVSLRCDEGVTFTGSSSCKGISFEGTGHAIFEQGVLEQCLSIWHIAADDLSEAQVVHLGGLEVTHSYLGHYQTFIKKGIEIYANNYGQSHNSCFIWCEKGINAGTYAHLIMNQAEFYGCATSIWADGGSHVAAPKSWLRSGNLAVRLSANASCMISDAITISDMNKGFRVLFNSQFHATELSMDNVSTHAQVDEHLLTELIPPIQPGVRTLDPDGYGSYHSGISYNYLRTTSYFSGAMTREVMPAKTSDDTFVRSSGTFLDDFPSENLTKPFVAKSSTKPLQKRTVKHTRQAKSCRGSRNCATGCSCIKRDCCQMSCDCHMPKLKPGPCTGHIYVANAVAYEQTMPIIKAVLIDQEETKSLLIPYGAVEHLGPLEGWSEDAYLMIGKTKISYGKLLKELDKLDPSRKNDLIVTLSRHPETQRREIFYSLKGSH